MTVDIDKKEEKLFDGTIILGSHKSKIEGAFYAKVIKKLQLDELLIIRWQDLFIAEEKEERNNKLQQIVQQVMDDGREAINELKLKEPEDAALLEEYLQEYLEGLKEAKTIYTARIVRLAYNFSRALCEYGYTSEQSNLMTEIMLQIQQARYAATIQPSAPPLPTDGGDNSQPPQGGMPVAQIWNGDTNLPLVEAYYAPLPSAPPEMGFHERLAMMKMADSDSQRCLEAFREKGIKVEPELIKKTLMSNIEGLGVINSYVQTVDQLGQRVDRRTEVSGVATRLIESQNKSTAPRPTPHFAKPKHFDKN